MGEPVAPTGNSITITAENQFTEGLYVAKDKEVFLDVNGSGTLTITSQYKLPGEADSAYRDNDTDGGVSGLYKWDGAGMIWRAGCKTGDFTSGTKVININGSSTNLSK
jgi:hypothetical protein